MLPAIQTALDGTLRLQVDGYHWSDGTPEPRVRPMRLADVAGNWRCIAIGAGEKRTTYVELPRGWQRQVTDADARAAVETLVREHGQAGAIYAEGIAEALDDHRISTQGYLIPVAEWDRALAAPCGVWWDKEHEADILAIAARLKEGE